MPGLHHTVSDSGDVGEQEYANFTLIQTGLAFRMMLLGKKMHSQIKWLVRYENRCFWLKFLNVNMFMMFAK